MGKSLVNPVAVEKCLATCEDVQVPVLDISYVRLVTENAPAWGEWNEGTVKAVSFQLERFSLNAEISLVSKGEQWTRFAITKLLPSSRAHLRSFLCPKKVGESIREDWRSGSIRHYHGLNESELWLDPSGTVIFTYLDPDDFEAHFLLRIVESSGAISVGKVSRKEYMQLGKMDEDLPLLPLSDKDIVYKLGECRDILTNLRPNQATEYQLKQRLLRSISDYLYSANYRVEVPPPKPTITSRPSV